MKVNLNRFLSCLSAGTLVLTLMGPSTIARAQAPAQIAPQASSDAAEKTKPRVVVSLADYTDADGTIDTTALFLDHPELDLPAAAFLTTPPPADSIVLRVAEKKDKGCTVGRDGATDEITEAAKLAKPSPEALKPVPPRAPISFFKRVADGHFGAKPSERNAADLSKSAPFEMMAAIFAFEPSPKIDPSAPPKPEALAAEKEAAEKEAAD